MYRELRAVKTIQPLSAKPLGIVDSREVRNFLDVLLQEIRENLRWPEAEAMEDDVVLTSFGGYL